MLTRRHLFRTLSAIALAPLAKLVPKDCDNGFDVNATQLLTHDGWKPYQEVPWCRQTLILKYPRESCAMFLTGRGSRLQQPVPQEEV